MNYANILIIDDDINFTDSKKRAWMIEHELQLTAKDNWTDGIKTLQVVLNAKKSTLSRKMIDLE